GTIASRTVRLPGTPRSTERIFPASGELTRKSTNLTAASGLCVFAETAQYMDALYQSSASAAEPVIDGGRSTVTPSGTSPSWATTWLDQATVMATLPVANRDWSIAWAASSTETDASGPALVSWISFAHSNHCVAVSTSKPAAPSLYWSCPAWRTNTWNRPWTEPIWVMP